MRADHDTFYRQLFAHPELVCELLAAVLPFPWAGRLDARGCRRVNGSFASDDGHQRHEDMVWRVQTGGGSGDLYLLVEFQSRPERCMALRMHVYAGLLLQDLGKQGLLPARHPLPYTAQAIDQPGNVMLALFQCTHFGTAEGLLPALVCIETWLRQRHNDGLRRTVTSWVKRHLRQRFREIQLPRNGTLEEVRTMYYFPIFATFADQLKFEAVQKGLQDGREEGRQALCHALRRLLERDVGPLPPAALERLAAADSEQLQEWLDQVIDRKRPGALLDGED